MFSCECSSVFSRYESLSFLGCLAHFWGFTSFSWLATLHFSSASAGFFLFLVLFINFVQFLLAFAPSLLLTFVSLLTFSLCHWLGLFPWLLDFCRLLYRRHYCGEKEEEEVIMRVLNTSLNDDHGDCNDLDDEHGHCDDLGKDNNDKNHRGESEEEQEVEWLRKKAPRFFFHWEKWFCYQNIKHWGSRGSLAKLFMGFERNEFGVNFLSLINSNYLCQHSLFFRWLSWSRSATSPISTNLFSCFKQLANNLTNLARQIYPRKKMKILRPISMACVLPRHRQMRHRISWYTMDHYCTFSPKTKRALKLSRWLFGQKVLTVMYDPSPRDTLHVSTSAKKMSFCALPKESLDNCPWVSVTLWWATWRNTL